MDYFESGRRRKSGAYERETHRSHEEILDIVREFYDSRRFDRDIPDEKEKAAVLLDYIEHLKQKYESENQKNDRPDKDVNKEIAALGFDIDALREGKIRSARLSEEENERRREEK